MEAKFIQILQFPHYPNRLLLMWCGENCSIQVCPIQTSISTGQGPSTAHQIQRSRSKNTEEASAIRQFSLGKVIFLHIEDMCGITFIIQGNVKLVNKHHDADTCLMFTKMLPIFLWRFRYF